MCVVWRDRRGEPGAYAWLTPLATFCRPLRGLVMCVVWRLSPGGGTRGSRRVSPWFAVGSCRLVSARVGSVSARVGSCRLVSARVGSCRHVGSCRLVSARVGSCRLVSARVGSCRLVSARVGSCRLRPAMRCRTHCSSPSSGLSRFASSKASIASSNFSCAPNADARL